MKRSFWLILPFVLFAAPSFADLLAAWEVTGIMAASVPVFTNTFSAPNITSNQTLLSLGSGVTANSATNTYGGENFQETSLADAITFNDYISWTVQADPGYFVSVTNISMNFARTSTGGSNMVLRSSIDSFTADLAVWTDFAATAGGGDTNITMNLSSANSVEFRLYVYTGTLSTGADRIRNLGGNDLSVRGTLTIPEPGTMAMLGLGALAVCIRRLRETIWG